MERRVGIVTASVCAAAVAAVLSACSGRDASTVGTVTTGDAPMGGAEAQAGSVGTVGNAGGAQSASAGGMGAETGGSGAVGGPTAGAGGAGMPVAAGGMTAAGGMPSGDGGAPAIGGAAAGGGPVPVPAVWPSSACTADVVPPADDVYTIQTSGTKPADCADAACGDWSSEREYAIFKPQGYDPTLPYALVFMGPGCGGTSRNIYPYDNNANGSIIRVGLRPSPEIQALHPTNPNQFCFDDYEGDDSVDFVFYENLYDLLDTQLCFDRNRVFAGGNSTGARLADQLGCRYAGDAERPIRGVLPRAGGLPEEAEYVPTCSSQPLAGFWVWEIGSPTYPDVDIVRAIDRAISVDDCPAGTTYETAMFADYPIDSSLPADTCKQILGCNPLYPLVECALLGNGQGSNDYVVNPGASLFLRSFQDLPQQ